MSLPIKTLLHPKFLVVATIVGALWSCSSDTSDMAAKPAEKNQTHTSAQLSDAVEVELLKVSGQKRMRVEAEASASMLYGRMAASPMFAQVLPAPIPAQQERYQHQIENGLKRVSNEPVSTFSIDVDTGSYSNVRRMLNQGMVPPSDAIRVEEFINYFNYQYPQPDIQQPFSINTDVAVSPWDDNKHLIRVALKGYIPKVDEHIGSNLVFLLDVSGSMDQQNKLPLLSRSLGLLSQQLSAKDSVSIVVYAGASGVVLEPTPGNNVAKIKQALMQLRAGGSTNGQAGIELAYNLAEQAFIDGGINRVILATDGDFNVGITDQNQLLDLIKQKRQKGIALTTLGFGQGNYNDHLMEQLADAGNGNYAYIDSINEARKVLVDELNATLMTIAKDVKIQVEFNPATVAEYRLVGYENRLLNTEDFNNDKVDAGEIGAGHTVTAFYEVSLVGAQQRYLDDLRYAPTASKPVADKHNLNDELAFVKLRYKPVDSDTSILLSQTIQRSQITDFAKQSVDFRFATAVVGFANKLKHSNYATMNFSDLIEMAQQAKGEDEFGYRAEFIQLVKNADSLLAGVAEPMYNKHTLSQARQKLVPELYVPQTIQPVLLSLHVNN